MANNKQSKFSLKKFGNSLFKNQASEKEETKKKNVKRLKSKINFDQMNHADFMEFIDNPDKVLRSQNLDVEAYDNLMEDTEVFAAFDVRDSGVLAKKWEIEQNNSDTSKYELIKEFFAKKINYRDITKALLKGRNFGYQPIYLQYDYYNEWLFPVKINLPHRKHFKFDKEGGLLLETSNFDYKPVDEYRFLISGYEKTYENPYGQPILSKCFWPVTFKKSSKKFWAVFVEKYGMPWLLGFLDNAQDDELNEWREELEEMVQDAVAVTDKKNELEVHEIGSKANSEIYQGMINDSNSEISKVILGHSAGISSTAGKLGNENQAESATKTVIESDMALVEEMYNKLIQYIFEINWPNETDLPKFKFIEEESLNKEKVDRDIAVAQLRQTNQFSDEYINRTYNYEEGDLLDASGEVNNTMGDKRLFTDDELNSIMAHVRSQGISTQEANDNLSSAFSKLSNDPVNINLPIMNNNINLKYSNYLDKYIKSESRDENTKDQQIIDDFIDTLAADEYNNTDLYGAMVDDIISQTKKYDSLQEIKEDYHKFYVKINTDKLQNRLISASLVAHVSGLHSVNVEIDEEEKEDAQNLSIPEFYARVQDGFIELQDLLFLLDKEPDDILEWFRSKEVVLSNDMETTIKLIKNHVFTVTGVNKLDMLDAFKKELEKAIKEGLSLNSFKNNIRSLYEQKGWLVKSEGKNLLPGYRLENIYRTNLQDAYMQGRWDRELSTIDLYPYVQAISVIDKSTTRECKALNLMVFNKNDKYYQTYLRSPGHFSCRRRSRSLNDTKLKKLGIKVTKGESQKSNKNQKGFEHNNKPWKPDLSKYPKELREMYDGNN